MLVFVSRLQTCSDTLTTAPQPPAVLFLLPTATGLQENKAWNVGLSKLRPTEDIYFTKMNVEHTLGVPLSQAMVEYEQGDYSRAVELLQPLRYGRMETGGLD
ncbi:unnamed protein product [Boreogadus saida]